MSRQGHTPLKQKLLSHDDDALEPPVVSLSSSMKVGTPTMAGGRMMGSVPPPAPPSGGVGKKVSISLPASLTSGMSSNVVEELRPNLNEFEEQAQEEGYAWDLILVMAMGNKVREAERLADEFGITFVAPNEIVHSLVNAGLQVYLYHGKPEEPGGQAETLYCKVRTPLHRLEIAAASSGYKLLLDSNELSLIGRRGVMSPGSGTYMIEPMDINEDPSISTYSPYQHIYATYSPDPRLTALWQKARGQKHPWSALHRIKITLGIINDSSETGCGLELEKLKQTGALLAYYPLRDKARVAWLDNNFFPAKLSEQPLDEMKEYLGEKLGLYFCFLNHYTQWLWILGVAGLVMVLDIIISAAIYDDLSKALGRPYTGIVFAVFAAFWAQFTIEYWKRSSSRKAMEWGMVGFEEEQRDRTAYGLDPKCENIHSPVNGKPIVYFPDDERHRRMRMSAAFICVLLLLVLGCVAVVFTIKFEMANSDDATAQALAGTVASIFNAVQIQVLNAVYYKYAVSMNEWENHRTDTIFEDALIIKLFVFQFVNSYSPLFYIAFIKGGIGDSCEGTCMSELSQTLAIIFISNVTVGNAAELAGPIIARVKNYFGLQTAANVKAMTMNKGQAEKEFELEDYDVMMSLIEDYSELSVQFGFVTMFVTACPIAPFMAYYSNLLEIRVDGYNILHAHRRPIPTSAEDIGSWLDIFQMTSFVAAITNSAIICFTMDIIQGDRATKVWCFILLQYFIFSIMSFFEYLIDDVPKEVSIQLERQEFLVRKVIDLELSDDEDDGNNFAIPQPKMAMEDDDLVMKAQGRVRGGLGP